MELEAYRVIAQIAAGLAGFVGIILTVRERLAGLPRHQVAGFLLCVIGVLAFALLPDFAFGLGFPEWRIWQVIGCVFGVYHLLVYVYFLKNYPDLRRMPPVQKAVSIASIPVIGAKILLGAGLFRAYAADIYHLGLLWVLGVSVFFFVQVVMNDGKGPAP